MPSPRIHPLPHASVQVTDAWPHLPPAVRKALGAVARDRARDVHEGISGSTGPWRPVRPLLLTRDGYDLLDELARRLMDLVLAAARRRASTAGELRDVLGVPAGRAPLLRPGAPLTADLLVAARPDIVLSGGVPAFVEFNIDGALGGTLQADLLGERFADAFAGADTGLEGAGRMSAPDAAVPARFAAIRTSLALGPGALLAIPVFRVGAAPGLADPDRFIAWLQPMCAAGAALGLDTRACRLEELRTGDDGTLLLGDERVDAVLRLFLAHDQPPSAGLDALVRSVRAGKVRLHTPEDTWMLCDKRTLAWLWEDRALLDAADRELVERHVPWTARLDGGPGGVDPAAVVARRESLVLKPGGGYGGAGVVLGPHVTPGEWARRVAAAAAEGGHVVQEYRAPDPLEMEFLHLESGEFRTASVPAVVGPFHFGGRSTSVLLRHGVPGGGHLMNAHHGAVLNAALVLDGGR